jgi:hypothetical protein
LYAFSKRLAFLSELLLRGVALAGLDSFEWPQVSLVVWPAFNLPSKSAAEGIIIIVSQD